tara:strand:- start:82 stop:327 length:246 start_codon:yes stop_codon:yes gene_type:complete
MNSTNQDVSQTDEMLPTDKDESLDSKINIPENSATTMDKPEFGWSAYAERVNGRFAMIGFIAILMIEIITRQTFIIWSGIK